jgi:hypothetical protein
MKNSLPLAEQPFREGVKLDRERERKQNILTASVGLVLLLRRPVQMKTHRTNGDSKKQKVVRSMLRKYFDAYNVVGSWGANVVLIISLQGSVGLSASRSVHTALPRRVISASGTHFP